MGKHGEIRLNNQMTTLKKQLIQSAAKKYEHALKPIFESDTNTIDLMVEAYTRGFSEALDWITSANKKEKKPKLILLEPQGAS